jgi:hypothetical protein
MDIFWDLQVKIRPKAVNLFSKSFIDLMNWIFNFDHVVRPSLAEIKEHKWFKGPVATKEEIIEEFTKRKQILESATDEEIPEVNISESFYDEHSIHRSIVTDQIEESPSIPALVRQEAMYVSAVKSYTQFFSTSKTEELFA